MQAIEQRADQLTACLIKKAEQTLITPLDREDILALAVAMGDVLGLIEEFAIKLVDYQLLPDDALKTFFDLVSMAVTCIADGVICLRTFQSIDELRSKMKVCEHRADELVRMTIQKSYEIAIFDASIAAFPRDKACCQGRDHPCSQSSLSLNRDLVARYSVSVEAAITSDCTVLNPSKTMARVRVKIIARRQKRAELASLRTRAVMA